MAAWQWLFDTTGVVVLSLVAFGLFLLFRRRLIARHGGTFELSVRVRTGAGVAAGRGWRLGIGRYQRGRLQWFRVFSPLPIPSRSWARQDLRVIGQRSPTSEDAAVLYGGHVIVECRGPNGPLDLAMSPASFTGFSSWLEAGPPGADWTQGSNRRTD